MRYGSLIGLMLVLGLAAGCSDDDDGGAAAAVAVFTASATAPLADGVRMEGTVVADDMVNIQIVLDGQTTSTDIYAFAFDILLSNSGVVQFIPGSALEGGVLETTPPQDVEVVVSQQGNRVIVGVTKTGGGAGNGFGMEERTIVSMDFTVSSGTTSLTFASTPAMKAPAALDSTTANIPSIIFDTVPATISR